MKIEMIFGGILALLVVVASAFFMLAGPGGSGKAAARSTPVDPIDAIRFVDGSVVCPCYDAAFKIAGKNPNVMTSRYETGYSQCRALGDRAAADAWTAGWNAQLRKRPYEASCRRFRQSRRRAG